MENLGQVVRGNANGQADVKGDVLPFFCSSTNVLQFFLFKVVVDVIL